MPAYMISEVEIIEEIAVRRYIRLAKSSIAAYGGHYLVRGAEAEVREGEPTIRKVIIVEFPSLEQAHD